MEDFIELFKSGFITEQIDYTRHVILLPKNVTAGCDLPLVIEKDKFTEIAKHARNKNPMNEAIFEEIKTAVSTNRYDLFQLFTENADCLMSVYRKKRNEYKSNKDADDSEELNLYEVLDIPDDTENLTQSQDDQEYMNYVANIDEILSALETAVKEDTFFDLFECTEQLQKENIRILSCAINDSLAYFTKEEQCDVLSMFIEILFTGELNALNMLNLFDLLSKTCLKNRDYSTIDKLLLMFVEKLYPDD